MGELVRKSKIRRAVDRVKRQWRQFNNKKVVPQSSIPPSLHHHHIRPANTARFGPTQSREINAKNYEKKKKNSVAKNKSAPTTQKRKSCK